MTSTSELVTFHHPFLLPGLDQPHPAGAFTVVTDREALDVSFPAFRVTTTIMLSDGRGTIEALQVAKATLDEALARDQATSKAPS